MAGGRERPGQICINPRTLHESLEVAREHFDEATVAHMSRVGRELLNDVAVGEIGADRGYRLCLERWCELPYFTREPEPVLGYELYDVFFRYPWFFYLLFTDPAL